MEAHAISSDHKTAHKRHDSYAVCVSLQKPLQWFREMGKIARVTFLLCRSLARNVIHALHCASNQFTCSLFLSSFFLFLS